MADLSSDTDVNDLSSGMPLRIPVEHDPFAPPSWEQAIKANRQAQTTKPPISDQIGDILGKTGRFAGRVATAPVNMVSGLYNKVASADELTRNPSVSSDTYADPQAAARDEDVPATALGLMGIGIPFAKPGALGTAGGKALTQELIGESQPVIRAYHGSPHDFEKFDIGKIGTGEGAQAYGHGLYFAERPGVAESYKTSLSSAMIDKKPADKFLEDMPKIDTIYDAIRHLKEKGQSPTIEDAAKFMDTSSIPAERRVAEAIKTYGSLDNVRRMMNKADVPIFDKMVKEGRVEANPGKMYEVSIKAHPDEFLDWDKLLSEQHPKVREAIDKFYGLPSEGAQKTMTGEDLSRALNASSVREIYTIKGPDGRYKPAAAQTKEDAIKEAGGDPSRVQLVRNPDPSVATEQMREAGIPGIKYLDQGSRTAAKPTYPGGYHITPPGQNIHGKWMVKGNDYNSKGLLFDTEAQAQAKLGEMFPGFELPKQKATHNYVVFHHDLVDIMKKYGLAGLSALPAAGAYHFQTQEPEANPFEGEQRQKFASGGAVQSDSTSRVTRDAFLYMENPDDSRFAQCGTCWLFRRHKQRCAILPADFPVTAKDSCGYYLEGKPDPTAQISHKATPQEVGFVKSTEVRCSNCKFGGGPTCKLYETLNKEAPDKFDLDTKIGPRGCCNAFKKATVELASEPVEASNIMTYGEMTRNHTNVQERASGGRVEAANINHNPTPAQRESGNYAKDRLSWNGIPLTIENAKGSVRRGIGKDGKPWQATLAANYGYARESVGADGDSVDIYLGPHLKAPKVWVIDQIDHDEKHFDEHKAMAAFASKAQALRAYDASFSDGHGKERIGHVEEMTVEQFKDWLRNYDTTKPIGPNLPHIDRTRSVRWMSELSRDGAIFYIDNSMPRQVTIKGKTFDPVEPLLRHEIAEFAAMKKAEEEFIKQHGRKPNDKERQKIYVHAHRGAGNPAEREYMQSKGISWAGWEAWCRGELARLEKKKETYPPPNVDVKPHGRGQLEYVGV